MAIPQKPHVFPIHRLLVRSGRCLRHGLHGSLLAELCSAERGGFNALDWASLGDPLILLRGWTHLGTKKPDESGCLGWSYGGERVGHTQLGTLSNRSHHGVLGLWFQEIPWLYTHRYGCGSWRHRALGFDPSPCQAAQQPCCQLLQKQGLEAATNSLLRPTMDVSKTKNGPVMASVNCIQLQMFWVSLVHWLLLETTGYMHLGSSSRSPLATS